ncbi:hypothetical protein [Aureibacter tunicatorum]|uniref:Uncharacterized protein n=1 Tax=Aureibacter tunicatorum TaxID=866807 RepID=A0AAE3XU46_9BACT|nr:hypothetical protein [Aureibacter tunicatorum]MDR6241906.1 hypothetical protein [Aureibacter tunicatorum]BDD07455.1 hypothetical protein AUTU_49380 [Aureibacter tunicatorum]
MNNIVKFLNNFFLAEISTKQAKLKPDLNEYNMKLNHMNSQCIDELNNSFGLIPINKLKDSEYYKKWENGFDYKPRIIFKISHYKNEKYKDLYLAYISISNPDKVFNLKYFDCFFIAKIENQYKIVRKYFVHKNRENNEVSWNPHNGDKDIDFYSAGDLISCERYIEPSRCEFSMKDYLEDK